MKGSFFKLFALMVIAIFIYCKKVDFLPSTPSVSDREVLTSHDFFPEVEGQVAKVLPYGNGLTFLAKLVLTNGNTYLYFTDASDPNDLGLKAGQKIKFITDEFFLPSFFKPIKIEFENFEGKLTIMDLVKQKAIGIDIQGNFAFGINKNINAMISKNDYEENPKDYQGKPMGGGDYGCLTSLNSRLEFYEKMKTDVIAFYVDNNKSYYLPLTDLMEISRTGYPIFKKYSQSENQINHLKEDLEVILRNPTKKISGGVFSRVKYEKQFKSQLSNENMRKIIITEDCFIKLDDNTKSSKKNI